jgi:hypothetical protein
MATKPKFFRFGKFLIKRWFSDKVLGGLMAR